MLLLISIYWAVTANQPFFDAAVADRDTSTPSTWLFLAALGVGLTAINFALLNLIGLFSGRRLLKPILALLLVLTALAAYYMQRFGVYLDATMLRNVLHTQPSEATELLSWPMAWHLAIYAGLPIIFIWRWRMPQLRWRTGFAARLFGIVAAVVILVLALLAVFQPLASWMRNHKEVRYLITPANLAWSVPRVVISDTRGAIVARKPIGLDAAPGPMMLARSKPTLLVLVVGETVRAANWGLSGYSRQTTPELAGLGVINFSQVDSCGTNTETSLPCMFAPVGRRDYDEDRIRGQQSLLHVLARAGVSVSWLDNQTGCKGVCEDLPSTTVREINPPGLCDRDNCLDEGLLSGLDKELAGLQGNKFQVLHMLGNHGPAYYRRYPPAYANFQPACNKDDLASCSEPEIVNAYDNAVLYTDHVLANLIKILKARADTVDSAVIFVSDHGESLGENGLFLHGIPYSIAPQVQTRVPMVMWLSPGFIKSNALDPACLEKRAKAPASHDNLFHTITGLLDVRTALHEPAWDLASSCRLAP